ncbi:hypothetical protein [Rhizobium herbae]|uniref:Uncharacterized protein n=1 Tax=Rhizobium herbae TaxID=508661 RepID=A0ABS4EPH1_9HYPH|nr:hypothetical protein [Rhizobium herbae]MBP1859840.1 hypothetical protein [Rhizobium herbae]
MEKRNFERQTASLRSFLQTGELGPINFAMTLLDVAALLGPPEWWITDSDDVVPLYWGYSGLELSFSEDSPHKLRCIKLGTGFKPDGKYSTLGRLLRLSNDGLRDDMRMSEFLKLFPAGAEGTQVGVCGANWSPVMDICTPNVRVIYDLSTRDEELLEDAASDGKSPIELIAMKDALSRRTGIYSIADPLEDRIPAENWRDFSVNEYLALVEGRKTN